MVIYPYFIYVNVFTQNVTVITHFLIRPIIFRNNLCNAQDKIRFDSYKTTITKCDSYNSNVTWTF